MGSNNNVILFPPHSARPPFFYGKHPIFHLFGHHKVRVLAVSVPPTPLLVSKTQPREHTV